MSTRTPHKHAEIIKAWADGADIQMKLHSNEWIDLAKTQALMWSPINQYRVKPEPKLDLVKYAHIGVLNYDTNFCTLSTSDHVWNAKEAPSYRNPANLKLTFDGETGKLKAVELIDDEIL